MRNSFIDTVIAAGVGRDDLIFISGDAGLGVFDGLRESAPDSFLNLGVAEQNMASFAAGLALAGGKVYLYNIIPFLLYRCYEQVRNDICYQKLPIVLVGIGSGVTYAPAGMSHYAIEDLGLAATLPNLTVISPCDAQEARTAAEFSLAASGPVYVRLAKRGEAAVHQASVSDITKPLVLCEGEDCALLFHGSIAEEAVAAAKLLQEAGISVRLLSVPQVQPLAEQQLLDILQDVPLVVTVEEHFAHVGLGGALARLAARHRPTWRLATCGLPNQFLHEVRDCAGMRSEFGLSARQLANDIQGWLINGK
jgi:transketolase